MDTEKRKKVFLDGLRKIHKEYRGRVATTGDYTYYPHFASERTVCEEIKKLLDTYEQMLKDNQQ